MCDNVVLLYCFHYNIPFNAGKIPVGIEHIVEDSLVALWPTEDINDESFWIADVIQKNIEADTVIVAPLVLEEDSQYKYVRGQHNMGVVTVKFSYIFLCGFALTEENMIPIATKSIINSIVM